MLILRLKTLNQRGRLKLVLLLVLYFLLCVADFLSLLLFTILAKFFSGWIRVGVWIGGRIGGWIGGRIGGGIGGGIGVWIRARI